MAIQLSFGTDGNQQRRGGEQHQARCQPPRHAALCPTDKQCLRQHVAVEKSEIDNQRHAKQQAAGAAARAGA